MKVPVPVKPCHSVICINEYESVRRTSRLLAKEVAASVRLTTELIAEVRKNLGLPTQLQTDGTQ
jgi:hypothetical protein